jgi:hypothetical protein
MTYIYSLETYPLETLINISNYWGNKIIPAIFLGNDTVLVGRYSVWIPNGYDNGAGGYSSRAPNDVSAFTGTAEEKADVLMQRQARIDEEKMRGY